MSDTMIAFIKKERFPTAKQLRKELAKYGLYVEEIEESLLDFFGYWPGELEGKEAGFEWSASDMSQEDFEDFEIDQKLLEGRDVCIELGFYEEDDVKACSICIVVLCDVFDAIAQNEEGELSITKDNCFQWAKEEMGYDLLKKE